MDNPIPKPPAVLEIILSLVTFPRRLDFSESNWNSELHEHIELLIQNLTPKGISIFLGYVSFNLKHSTFVCPKIRAVFSNQFLSKFRYDVLYNYLIQFKKIFKAWKPSERHSCNIFDIFLLHKIHTVVWIFTTIKFKMHFYNNDLTFNTIILTYTFTTIIQFLILIYLTFMARKSRNTT